MESVEPVSIHGEFGTETSQHPWSPVEKWCGDLSAPMECHGELGLETCQHSEYHEELVKVDTVVEYHEKSVMVDSLMECHVEFVEVSAQS